MKFGGQGIFKLYTGNLIKSYVVFLPIKLSTLTSTTDIQKKKFPCTAMRWQRVTCCNQQGNFPLSQFCTQSWDARECCPQWTQDVPTCRPSLIFTPVQGSFPLLLRLRKPASCGVKESRVIVFVHESGQSQHCLSPRSDRIALLPLALFSNCLHLCLRPACTCLLTAPALLLH